MHHGFSIGGFQLPCPFPLWPLPEYLSITHDVSSSKILTPPISHFFLVNYFKYHLQHYFLGEAFHDSTDQVVISLPYSLIAPMFILFLIYHFLIILHALCHYIFSAHLFHQFAYKKQVLFTSEFPAYYLTHAKQSTIFLKKIIREFIVN